MYKVKISNPETGQSKELDLPVKDRLLDEELSSIGYTDIENELILSDFINDEEDMPLLPKSVINGASIFEVNHLSQRLSLLYPDQKEVFSAAVYAYGTENIKDLINLAMEAENDCYEILEGIEDNEELGRYYIENEYPSLDNIILDNLDYHGVGCDLDKYKYEGVYFDKGYIFKSSNIDEELYDGKILPDLDYDKDYLVKIRYVLGNGDEVFLKLPTTQMTMQRCYKECQSSDNLGEINIDPANSVTFGRWRSIGEHEDIEQLNNVLTKVENSLTPKELEKLKAVFNYAEEVRSEENLYARYGLTTEKLCDKLSVLYENIDDFDFFLKLKTPAEYAEQLIKTGYLEMGEELYPYIRYGELGLDLIDQTGGKFVTEGFVIDEVPYEHEISSTNEESEDIEL